MEDVKKEISVIFNFRFHRPGVVPCAKDIRTNGRISSMVAPLEKFCFDLRKIKKQTKHIQRVFGY